jgi:NAD+ synthase (glutamine-hydrolysing)
MIVTVAQINTVIGDFSGNADKILSYVSQSASLGAELVIFPEMCLCGYPPMDLLNHESFVDENLKQLRRIQKRMPPDIAVVLGYLDKNRTHSGKPFYNMISLIFNGEVVATQPKTLLPAYDVFDETRYFEPARTRRVVPFKGERLGIAICEDLWWEGEPAYGTRYPVDPVEELLDRGTTLLLAPSASPFFTGKAQTRLSLLSRIGRSSGTPTIYVNMVGGNDSLIFDGRSMVTSKDGALIRLGKSFEEDLFAIDTTAEGPAVPLKQDKYGDLEAALTLGLRDYITKCGFQSVHVNLSGGIDSALVAVLATKALGAERVTALSLPSRYSSRGSIDDARELATRLGIRLELLPIEDVFGAFLATLKPIFEGTTPDITEENIQARIRGVLAMAYSNKFSSSLLLATGNKSELATGYCTLYGDLTGGLAVLGDLFKTEVYEMARSINEREPIIPQAILEKAPSAELRPDQKDEDSLPPYGLLDKILSMYLLDNLTFREIVAEGYDASVVSTVLRMVGRAEYKRRQAPPVLKVSPRAFGTGRRMPIAREVYEA